MARGILVVQSAPAEEARTAEYHKWYNDTHLPEVLSIPGFIKARRFRAMDVPGPTPEGLSAVGGDPDEVPASALMENLAIYEVEADDLPAAYASLLAAAAAGQLNISDAMQMQPMPPTQLFELLLEREA